MLYNLRLSAKYVAPSELIFGGDASKPRAYTLGYMRVALSELHFSVTPLKAESLLIAQGVSPGSGMKSRNGALKVRHQNPIVSLLQSLFLDGG